MAAVLPTSTVEQAIISKATAPRYYKLASDLTYRRRLWLAMLQEYGLIEYNSDSYACVWNAEYSQPDVKQYGDAGGLEFNEHDALTQFTIDVRGYVATNRLTLKKELMNKGPSQLDNLKNNIPIRLVKRLRQVLFAELYVDGNAANNNNRFHGIGSFDGVGTVVAADKVAQCSDSYAGQSTAQAQGGQWSTNLATPPNATLATDWPLGSGSSEYDFSSPLLVNYSSTSWKSSGTTWYDNCEEAMRFARIAQVSRGAKADDSRVPYMHLLSADLYADFLEHWSASQRIIVPHNDASRLGFADTMNFEGDIVHYESDCPAGTGYGIAPSQMEMFILGPQLIQELNEFSLQSFGTNYAAFTFGNLRFQPKFFTKYAAYA